MGYFAGTRRSRNRGRGQILVGSAKPSTLQFEADFDFETANAQFNKDDLEKEVQNKLDVQGTSRRRFFLKRSGDAVMHVLSLMKQRNSRGGR